MQDGKYVKKKDVAETLYSDFVLKKPIFWACAVKADCFGMEKKRIIKCSHMFRGVEMENTTILVRISFHSNFFVHSPAGAEEMLTQTKKNHGSTHK